VQWRGKRAIIAAQLYGSHQHKPALEVERILVVYLTTTRAQAKGMTPAITHEWAGWGGGSAPPLLGLAITWP
jgi:hypothetical protein